LIVTTAATIRDGDSLVIGGLVQESELNSITRVPFLGDLPLIGALFRLSHQTHQRANLYILVTPHIEPAPEPRASAPPR
jgi:type II secretory pathway component GspD/PulD (secretin)